MTTVSDKVQLKLRVCSDGRRQVAIPPGRPESFWDSLKTLGRQEDRSTIVLEDEFKIDFPRAVRHELKVYFELNTRQISKREQASQSATLRAADLIPLIGISVACIRYGSLDLALEFAGAKRLVELFDGNIDVFIMFAQTYLPRAFEATLHSMHFTCDGLLFDVLPRPGPPLSAQSGEMCLSGKAPNRCQSPFGTASPVAQFNVSAAKERCKA